LGVARLRGILGLIAVIVALVLWLLVLIGCSLGVVLEEGRVSVKVLAYVENPYTSTIPLALRASLTTGRKPAASILLPVNVSGVLEPSGVSVNMTGAGVVEVSLPGASASLMLKGVASAPSMRDALARMMVEDQHAELTLRVLTPLGVSEQRLEASIPTRQYFSSTLRGLVEAAASRLEGAGIGVDGAYVRIVSARLVGQEIDASKLLAVETLKVCVKAEPSPPLPFTANISLSARLVDESTSHRVAYTLKPLNVTIGPSVECGVMEVGIPLENVSEALLYAAWILGVQGTYNATVDLELSASAYNLPPVTGTVSYNISLTQPFVIHTSIAVGKARIPVTVSLLLSS